MTIAREIRKMVDRLDGVGICDLCLTDRLNLSVGSQANTVTRALAAEARYERQRDPCGLCGTAKIVTRRRTA